MQPVVYTLARALPGADLDFRGMDTRHNCSKVRKIDVIYMSSPQKFGCGASTLSLVHMHREHFDQLSSVQAVLNDQVIDLHIIGKGW